MSIERRQFNRSLFSLENEIIAKFTIAHSQEKPFIVHVRNISEGGVFFTWRSHRNINLKVGDHIVFQEIRKGERTILSLELTAKIVWKSEDFPWIIPGSEPSLLSYPLIFRNS